MHQHHQHGGSYTLHVGEENAPSGVAREPYPCDAAEQEEPRPGSLSVVPPRVCLTAQFADGAVREWKDLLKVEAALQLLREMGDVASAGQQGGEAAVMGTTLCSPLTFFWVDVSGAPLPQDLGTLLDFLCVSPYTQRRWRAAAAAAVATEPLANVELPHEDGDDYYDDATDLDCLRAFVREQYVQLRLIGLSTEDPTPCGSQSGGEYESEKRLQRPDRLRVNLLDASETGALTPVQVLCFAGGVVTWRVRPDVEGWEHIPRSLERRLCGRNNTATMGGNECGPRRPLSTSLLMLTVLEELYTTFLPDTTVVINEVDAIDAMLPLVRQRQSDQADVLRRVRMLRRSLSVHRRMLMSKVSVLELLNRSTIRVLLPFMNPCEDLDMNLSSARQRKHVEPAIYEAGDDTTGSTSAARHSSAYSAIARPIQHVLSKLEDARRVLTNSIIIYSSGVAATNSRSSNKSDTLSVVLGYVALTSIPPTIVASQWGMNVYVPWVNTDSTVPFWSIAGLSGLYMLLVLAYPLYCWIKGKPENLVF
ncbi:unnamed protein product [Trypanosoma congolense IL3000]|uniref:WGS project CAEQ00000000 data, annotated contig 913 n=1 Tax=Trypanosoma congolense (strain IL3000) TaxID=1068625 RepID=F9WJI1_TRYCI|nr:unnamed protein product [Trypanosoma congolense IL3000]